MALPPTAIREQRAYDDSHARAFLLGLEGVRVQGGVKSRKPVISGYSAMMVTRVKEEWETNGLCRSSRAGRMVEVEFAAEGRKLWDLAERLLSSPVRKTHWARWKQPGEPALNSGYTALSAATRVGDDTIPTWALSRDACRELGTHGAIHLVGGPEVADVRVEEWNYDPALLSAGPSVDPMSLVLALRHHADDRVQQQLDTLLETRLKY